MHRLTPTPANSWLGQSSHSTGNQHDKQSAMPSTQSSPHTMLHSTKLAYPNDFYDFFCLHDNDARIHSDPVFCADELYTSVDGSC